MCKRCGKPTKKHAGRNTQYCSWACRYPDTTRPCEVCGTIFKPQPNSVGRFCSYACYGTSGIPASRLAAYQGPRRRAYALKRMCRNTMVIMRRHRVRMADYRQMVYGRSYRLVAAHDIECVVCGVTFFGKAMRYCSPCSVRRNRELKSRAKARRRAAKRGVTKSERFTATEIYERDGYRCHLCKRKVRRNVVVPHDLAPTIDHLIPIADGGMDTRRNVATAHFRCNWERKAGGTVQLRLVA
jgi:5-methylcytosine-specific restriction endonuclease McrA